MNKLIAVLVLSSALLAFAAADVPSIAPASSSSNSGKPTTVSSIRSKCLNAAAKSLNSNLKSCKEKTGTRLADCKQKAYNQNKIARANCSTNRNRL